MLYVPVEQLHELVRRAILEVKVGVQNARAQGVIAELPEKIDFEVQVIASNGFQALPVSKANVRVTSGNQGGQSQEVGVTTEQANDTGGTTTDESSNTTRNSSQNRTVNDTENGSQNASEGGGDTRNSETDYSYQNL